MTMEAFACTKCSYETISPKTFCPRCGNDSFDGISTSNEGKVYSYTTIHVAPPEFADFTPYQVVLVQLTDHLRVTGYSKETVKIGDTVRIKEIQHKAIVFSKV